MTTQNDHHDHWMDRTLGERVLVLTIVAVTLVWPVALLFFH